MDTEGRALVARAGELLAAAQAAAAGAGVTFSPGMTLLSRQKSVTYELQAKLGSGAFGEVWRCKVISVGKSSSTLAATARSCVGEQRAVKIVRTEDIADVQAEVARHKRAVELAGGLHVPQLYDDSEALVDGGRGSPAFIIVMQLIEGLAANRLSLPEAHRQRERIANVLLHDVLVALGRLHSQGVIHRDVKPANVLVNHQGECYLCDFGVSLFLSDIKPHQEMDQAGTPLYMAPEMLKTSPVRYDQKVDVWSLGCMGYELDLGRTPLLKNVGEVPTKGLIFNTLRTMPSPVFESNFSLRYRNLVQMCLEADPARRASSHELIREQMPSIEGDRRLLERLMAA